MQKHVPRLQDSRIEIEILYIHLVVFLKRHPMFNTWHFHKTRYRIIRIYFIFTEDLHVQKQSMENGRPGVSCLIQSPNVSMIVVTVMNTVANQIIYQGFFSGADSSIYFQAYVYTISIISLYAKYPITNHQISCSNLILLGSV